MPSSTNQTVVALVRCERYDEQSVREAVGRGLDLLGGVEQFVRPGEEVLLKPNLLVPASPEKLISPHPVVFEAVAQHLQAAGTRLTYGDSPAFGPAAVAAWRAGLAGAAAQLGIPLVDFSKGKSIAFPEGGLIRRFTIAAGALAVDGIVSLSKLKTHGLTRMTGAIKNQFGCVPGVLKAEFHARLPDVDHFSQMLVDLNRLLRPRLYVMDGIVAMEGNGPRNGDPRPMAALLLSGDPVALDATACRMMNLDPALVPTVTWGQRLGLGTYRQPEIRGDPLESFVVPDFVVNRRRGPTTGRQGWLGSLMRDWVVPRPVLNPATCTCCGTCVQVCPVSPKAIDFRDGPGRPPVYEYGDCIRCYCCQETCPERAITVQTPLLGRVIHR